jgi:predicted PurR-regulated permease PerM
MARPRTGTRAPRFVLLASICVIVAALYFAQDVLIPLALAILVSFLLAPLVRRLERLGLPRIVSVVVVMSVVITLVAGLGYLVYSQVVDLANDLPRYEHNIRLKVARVMPRRGGMLEKVQKAAEELSRAAESPSTQPTQPTQPTTAAAMELARHGAARVAGATPPPATGAPATQPNGTEANPLWVVARPPVATPLRVMQEYVAKLLPRLGTAGLVLVFVIFMLIAREDMRDRVIRLIGHGQLNLTTQALDDASTRISRYLLMQMIVNGTYGLAIAIGLWCIGVPSPVLWGFLCCVLRFIPYIGPWIGAAFPLTLALASFPGFRQFVYTGLLFVIIELLSNNAMEPWLYGASTGMSTVAVLVSAVFWTWLWGPIGLVMATPLTVCLVVLGKYVPQLKFLDILLGDEPVLAPAERVYQRLLAGDPEEAEELLDEYLGKQTLEEVYDHVLLPALAMAELDAHRGRLDEERSVEIHRAVRQLAEELGAQEKTRELRRAADRTIAVARGEEAPAADDSEDKPAPDDRPPRPRLAGEPRAQRRAAARARRGGRDRRCDARTTAGSSRVSRRSSFADGAGERDARSSGEGGGRHRRCIRASAGRGRARAIPVQATDHALCGDADGRGALDGPHRHGPRAAAHRLLRCDVAGNRAPRRAGADSPARAAQASCRPFAPLPSGRGSE